MHKYLNSVYSILVKYINGKMLDRSLKSPLPTIIPEELPLLFEKSFNDRLSTTHIIPTTPITFPVSLENVNLPHLIK